jgi:hypothetical protein
VRVADRRDPVQVAGARREQPVEPRAVAVERERVQLAQEQPRPRGVDGGLALERAQHLEVVPLPPRVRVEAGELARAQRERGRRALAGLAEAERVVAGELERERHPLPAGRGGHELGARPHLARAGVQPLHRRAAEPQGRLSARVEQEVGPRARPPLRHSCGAAQPVRGEQRAERLAEDRRAVVQILGLVVPDPADRPGELEPLHRHALGVHPRAGTVHRLGDPVPRVPAVRQHAAGD